MTHGRSIITAVYEEVNLATAGGSTMLNRNKCTIRQHAFVEHVEIGTYKNLSLFLKAIFPALNLRIKKIEYVSPTI